MAQLAPTEEKEELGAIAIGHACGIFGEHSRGMNRCAIRDGEDGRRGRKGPNGPTEQKAAGGGLAVEVFVLFVSYMKTDCRKILWGNYPVA